MRVVASVVVLVGVAVACGGASEVDVLDPPPSNATASSGSTGSSGTSGAASSSTSSSGTASSSSGTASSSSGTVNDGGIDSGLPPGTCSVNIPTSCAPNEYCRTEGCATQIGKCAARPSAELPALSPVCGCDHITYWNPSLAAIRGVNLAGMGACAQGVDCTRGKCGGGAKCNLEQFAVCIAGDSAKGVCWQIPKSCDGTNTRAVRRCSGGACNTFCGSLDDERPFAVPLPACN